MDRKTIDREIDSLSVFSAVCRDEVFHAFRQCFYADDAEHDYSAVTNFAGALYNLAHTDNWTEYLKNLVFSMESPCSYFAARGETMPVCMEQAARHDLQVLSHLAQITPAQMTELIQEKNYLPQWQTNLIDLETLYFERLAHIGKYGFGIWAKYRMFQMKKKDNSFILNPVSYPDTVKLSDLVGYTQQRNQVIENTEALLNGLRAANILLYGSAGTGKSATVKAVANAYAEHGLRLIELSKDELHLLPELLEKLNANPLKFILFIDDLSFQENDDDFSALKAVLEGSVSARAYNTVIYATSNRRHIVRETFSQRTGDEIHRNDTIQETISLSERFGMQILFDQPNKDLYLEIVRNLAGQHHLQINEEMLSLEEERFAMRKSGRSARAARQFVEQLCCAEYHQKNK